MMFAYFILIICLGLAALLWTLYSRVMPEPSLFEEPSGRLLPPAEVVQAIFDPRDRVFASAQGSPELLRTLETRRRELAILWMSSVKREAVRALREYRMSARQLAKLSPMDELRTFGQMTSFLLLYCMIAVLVRVASVFRTRRLLSALFDLSRPLLDTAASLPGFRQMGHAAGGTE